MPKEAEPITCKAIGIVRFADYKQALLKLQASDLNCQQVALAEFARHHRLSHRVRRWISSLM